MATFGLKFISGKYQGGELAVPDESELLIGRANDLDMVLVEDMVSRKHAKLAATGGALSIVDLGSTNGTFVNGEKIRRAELKKNDRILIGTSIIKVISAGEMTSDMGQEGNRLSLREKMEELANRSQAPTTMSGELEEVPLPDLLQLFATNKKSGVLRISGAHRGSICLKQGQLQAVVIEEHADLSPLKAICRMVNWSKGSFCLEPYDEKAEEPAAFKESTESVLIEALRQADELRRLSPDLPPLEARVVWCIPMVPRLAALNEKELDTLQLALNFNRVETLLDKTPATDLEAFTQLHKLLREGYLEVE